MRMSRHAVALGLALLAGCQTGPDSARRSCLEPPQLEPDLNRSFATLAGDTEFTVCVMGTDWALRAYLPRDAERVPRGCFTPRACTFYRGPNIGRFLRPPSGPPAPPVPDDGRYIIQAVSGLTVTVLGGQNEPEPEGYLDVKFSKCTVGNEVFSAIGPVRLTLKGPYP